MTLNDIGQIAYKFWAEIPQHFAHVSLGAHIIMPNHMHGILILDDNNIINANSTQPSMVCDDKDQFMSAISPKAGSVSTIIRSYKSACTKHINLSQPKLNFKWQERFHDHIIRNDGDFQRIKNYIINNPKNWQSDKFFL